MFSNVTPATGTEADTGAAIVTAQTIANDTTALLNVPILLISPD
jgi:hypothetical protein